MLTRRAIRIKVMQTLYGFGQDDELSFPLIEKKLERNMHETYRLFLYCLSATIHCIAYIRNAVEIRVNKHIPSEEDQLHHSSLADSAVFQALEKDKILHRILKNEKIIFESEVKIEKKIFDELGASEKYLSYLKKNPLAKNDHLKMLQYIFRELISEHEAFQENVEEKFMNWSDDKVLVNRQMHETLRAYQKIVNSEEKKDGSPVQPLKEQKELIKFGKELLFKTMSNEAELKSIVKPRLKNWEEDRVAAVDLILLRLGVSEFLYFPEIPVKVSMNEYIELSKMYSTPKSHEFVNGILDNVVRELKQEGRINKSGRGLI